MDKDWNGEPSVAASDVVGFYESISDEALDQPNGNTRATNSAYSRRAMDPARSEHISDEALDQPIGTTRYSGPVTYRELPRASSAEVSDVAHGEDNGTAKNVCYGNL